MPTRHFHGINVLILQTINSSRVFRLRCVVNTNSLICIWFYIAIPNCICYIYFSYFFVFVPTTPVRKLFKRKSVYFANSLKQKRIDSKNNTRYSLQTFQVPLGWGIMQCTVALSKIKFGSLGSNSEFMAVDIFMKINSKAANSQMAKCPKWPKRKQIAAINKPTIRSIKWTTKPKINTTTTTKENLYKQYRYIQIWLPNNDYLICD